MFFILQNYIKQQVMKPTVHDYRHYVQGRDYFFELARGEAIEGERFYMTGSGQDVKLDDRILLQLGSQPRTYRIEQIDYYCDAPDLWIALLTPIA